MQSLAKVKSDKKNRVRIPKDKCPALIQEWDDDTSFAKKDFCNAHPGFQKHQQRIFSQDQFREFSIFFLPHDVRFFPHELIKSKFFPHGRAEKIMHGTFCSS